MLNLIDLDNNATTPVLRAVCDAMIAAMAPSIANPSSSHRQGQAARALIETARSDVAEMLAVSPDRIIFTSGATEGNDAVLRHHRAKILLTTAGAHPSLIGGHTGRQRFIEVDRDGRIDLKSYENALQEIGPCIVALAMVNGETGVVQPIDEVCEIGKRYGAAILIDAAQAVGRLPRECFEFQSDYVTVSAHKMNGPKGVGCLIVGDNAELPLLASGGGQERGRRSGTENVPGIIGFGTACRQRLETLEQDLQRMTELRDRLEQHLEVALPFGRINSKQAPRAATTTSLTTHGVDGMALVARLDTKGILCSQVSACSSGRPEPSAALMAMGLNDQEAFSTIRFSVSVQTTTDQIDEAAAIIAHEAQFLHDVMGGVA